MCRHVSCPISGSTTCVSYHVSARLVLARCLDSPSNGGRCFSPCSRRTRTFYITSGNAPPAASLAAGSRTTSEPGTGATPRRPCQSGNRACTAAGRADRTGCSLSCCCSPVRRMPETAGAGGSEPHRQWLQSSHLGSAGASQRRRTGCAATLSRYSSTAPRGGPATRRTRRTTAGSQLATFSQRCSSWWCCPGSSTGQ